VLSCTADAKHCGQVGRKNQDLTPVHHWMQSQESMMVKLLEELAAQGRSLPPEERVRLLDILLESLDEPAADDVEQAWALEIERRVRAHEQGEGLLFDVEDVMAEAEKIAP
jgi:putative addiction module component (TIGR02574 family)